MSTIAPSVYDDPRAFLQQAFRELFDPTLPTEGIAARYFHPDYRQWVDGTVLDYPHFLRHIDTVKRHAAQMSICFTDVLRDGEQLAERHEVHATMRDGSRMQVVVMAFHTLRDGRIAEIRELTRIEQGDPALRDLGSRVEQV